jgi:hypothetical protein
MTKHRCKSSRVGDWIIHECPECDFQLWHNLLSDETVTSNMRVDINHSGFYAPEELDVGMTWQKD